MNSKNYHVFLRNYISLECLLVNSLLIKNGHDQGIKNRHLHREYKDEIKQLRSAGIGYPNLLFAWTVSES